MPSCSWSQAVSANGARTSTEREGAPRQVFTLQDGTHDWWHWIPAAGPAGLALEEGTHSLTAKSREDGARLSRVLDQL